MRKPDALAFSLALLALPLAAQPVQRHQVELGVQSQDISGSTDVYRSQINEDEGLLLRGLTYTLNRPEGDGFLTRFHVDAAGFAASPNGRLRVAADRARVFSFRLDYKELSHFNALPGYPDPGVDGEIIPGRRAVDRTRRFLDMELELMPQHWLRPLIGFRWNDYSGPARTTYHAGEDEFALDADLDETETEFRAGFSFSRGAFQGELIQGWRALESDERLTLAPGAESGALERPVLGVDNTLESLERTVDAELDAPVTSAFVRAQAHPRLAILGSYIYADQDGESVSSERFLGSLTSFQLRRFFGGVDESARAEVESPSWRGELRAEARPVDRLQAKLGYVARHRELDGRALTDLLYLDTIAFGGGEPRDLSALLNAETHMERDEDQFEATLHCDLGPRLRAWTGWTRLSQDIEVDADLAQIVTPGGQEGVFEREIDRVSAGVDYRAGRNGFSASWQSDDADRAVVRTDYLDRRRVSMQAHGLVRENLRLAGRCLWTKSDNDTPQIVYESDQRQLALDFEIVGVKNFDMRLSYGVYEIDSEALYLQPQNFQFAQSIHKETGDEFELSLGLEVGRCRVEGEYASYDNQGALSFKLDRWKMGASVRIAAQLDAIVEARVQQYEEPGLPVADYDAEHYAFLLRWRR